MLLHGRWCALRRQGRIKQLHNDGAAPPIRPKTLLEMLGKNRLIIEHHRGISCYGPEEIQVRATFGYITIRGADLCLCCMRREQLCIQGRIDSLELMGRETDGAVE